MMTSANFLVGKQNSSKAGFTRSVYCFKIVSRSLSRSSMSLRTKKKEDQNEERR